MYGVEACVQGHRATATAEPGAGRASRRLEKDQGAKHEHGQRDAAVAHAGFHNKGAEGKPGVGKAGYKDRPPVDDERDERQSGKDRQDAQGRSRVHPPIVHQAADERVNNEGRRQHMQPEGDVCTPRLSLWIAEVETHGEREDGKATQQQERDESLFSNPGSPSEE